MEIGDEIDVVGLCMGCVGCSCLDFLRSDDSACGKLPGITCVRDEDESDDQLSGGRVCRLRWELVYSDITFLLRERETRDITSLDGFGILPRPTRDSVGLLDLLQGLSLPRLSEGRIRLAGRDAMMWLDDIDMPEEPDEDAGVVEKDGDRPEGVAVAHMVAAEDVE
jgi:hypothetical protein